MIQIFTRKGGGVLRPSFSAGDGHGTYQLVGGASGGGERGWFNLDTSRFDTGVSRSPRDIPLLCLMRNGEHADTQSRLSAHW